MKQQTLTENQRATLKTYEKHLHSAYYADYVVGLPASAVRALFGVFNEINSTHERVTNCNYCVLRIVKQLAALYYKNDTIKKEQAKSKPTSKTKKATKK